MASPSESYGFNEKGEKVIPASRRKDGTLRKEIRVRSDYIPLEERAKFQSRGTEFRKLQAASSKCIPGSRVVGSSSTGQEGGAKRVPPGGTPVAEGMTASAKKRQAKKKKAETLAADVEAKEDQNAEANSVDVTAIEDLAEAFSQVKLEEESPNKQELKSYRKLLRQICDLQKKQSKGQNLSDEEIQKISEKESVREMIAKLKEVVSAEEAAGQNDLVN